MKAKGRGFPFAAVRPLLRTSDIVFGNLECCVSQSGYPLTKRYTFRADPRIACVLREVGVTVVSCANNHAWDFGRIALLDTVRTVNQAGTLTVGAGANRREAHRLRIITRKGVRVGFLAYLGLLPPLVPESPTAPSLAIATEPVVRADVKAARSQVDVLIVSLHGGKENSSLPTPHQAALAHIAIDAGADLVIGHHSHVVQPMVRYHGKWICYSLGNFVFSTTGRGSGALLNAVLSRAGVVSAQLIPLRLIGSQPHFPRRFPLSTLISPEP